MILHNFIINQPNKSFQLIFSPQEFDIQNNYELLLKLIGSISISFGHKLPVNYIQVLNDIDKLIKQHGPHNPKQEVTLFVNCSNIGITVGFSGGSGIDFSVLKK